MFSEALFVVAIIKNPSFTSHVPSLAHFNVTLETTPSFLKCHVPSGRYIILPPSQDPYICSRSFASRLPQPATSKLRRINVSLNLINISLKTSSCISRSAVAPTSRHRAKYNSSKPSMALVSSFLRPTNQALHHRCHTSDKHRKRISASAAAFFSSGESWCQTDIQPNVGLAWLGKWRGCFPVHVVKLSRFVKVGQGVCLAQLPNGIRTD